jgi:hypothetical protein
VTIKRGKAVSFKRKMATTFTRGKAVSFKRKMATTFKRGKLVAFKRKMATTFKRGKLVAFKRGTRKMTKIPIIDLGGLRLDSANGQTGGLK